MKSICLLLVCAGVAQAQNLTGLGIVVGLNGTGGNKPNVIRRFFPDADPKTCSICIVTATKPKHGNKLTFKVQPLDGANLHGGILVATKLLGPDGKPYAIASGALKRRKDARKNHPSTWFGETILPPVPSSACVELSSSSGARCVLWFPSQGIPPPLLERLGLPFAGGLKE